MNIFIIISYLKLPNFHINSVKKTLNHFVLAVSKKHVWHIEKVWHLVIFSLDFGSFFDWIYIVIWWFCKVGHESFVKSKFLLSFPSRAPMATASRAEYAVLYWLAKYCFFNKIFDRNNRIAEQNQSQAHILYLFLKFHPYNVIGSVAQW